VDERIKRLESEVGTVKTDVNEVKTDIKLLNKTLQVISETLHELKEQNKTLHNVDRKLISDESDIQALKEKTKTLFKYKDDLETRIRTLEKSDTTQSVKLGGGEKFFWMGISALIGIAVVVVKNGGIG